jgi:oligoribonuclease (3'-5' exoribonuclease)
MIAWTDVETTGLNENAGELLEVAIVVTDDELNEVGHCSTVVLPTAHNLEALFELKMDSVVREMHTKNELLDELRSGNGLLLEEAQSMLVGWAQSVFVKLPNIPTGQCVFCGKKQEEHTFHSSVYPGDFCYERLEEKFTERFLTVISQTPLAGSTIGFDRRWLRHHMPRLEELFNYRSIDVSTLTELAKRWAPAIYEGRPKAGKAHRALADVRESIAYLKYYRDCGFVAEQRA